MFYTEALEPNRSTGEEEGRAIDVGKEVRDGFGVSVFSLSALATGPEKFQGGIAVLIHFTGNTSFHR